MRNIPAKALYIAGLSDGAFPRGNTPDTLDLITYRARGFSQELSHWDRTPRDEDCLLLLEAILAAGKYLRLSYVGKNARNNSIIPPCAPLAKLRNFLIDLTGTKKNEPGMPDFETLHRLHPFDRAYFSAGTAKKLFSFNRNNYQTACAAGKAKTEVSTGKPFPRPFKLREGEKEKLYDASLRNFILFFSEPAKFFCRNRLGILYRKDTEKFSDDDPTKNSFPESELWKLFRKILFEMLSPENAGIPAETRIKNLCHGTWINAQNAGLAETLPGTENVPEKQAEKFAPTKMLAEMFPRGLLAAPENGKPLDAEVDGVRVTAEFDGFFMSPGDNRRVLILSGKKNLDWRVIAETCISALFLRKALAGTPTDVFYFPYAGIKPLLVSHQAITDANTDFSDLLNFYKNNLESAPFFLATGSFKLAEKSPGKQKKRVEPTENYFEEMQSAWQKGEREKSENALVFGSDIEHFQSEIMEKSFLLAKEFASMWTIVERKEH